MLGKPVLLLGLSSKTKFQKQMVSKSVCQRRAVVGHRDPVAAGEGSVAVCEDQPSSCLSKRPSVASVLCSACEG